MPTDPRILIVEPDAVAGRALLESVEALGYTASLVDAPDKAVALLEQSRAAAADRPIGVVLVDQDASGMGRGIELVRQLHDDWPSVVSVLTSGFRKVESAVSAMRLGAADYLLKPIVEAELRDALARAVQRHLLLYEHQTVQQPVEAQPAGDDEDGDESRKPHPADEQARGETWTPMPLAEAMKLPEQRVLLAALEANGWNRGKTAKQLDINRTTLYKKIRQYRLDEPG